MERTGCRPFAALLRVALTLIFLAAFSVPAGSHAREAGNCGGVDVWYATIADLTLVVDPRGAWS